MSDLDIIIGQLEAVGVTRVYAFGEVPHKPKYPYAAVSLSPGVPAVRTLDGSGDPVGRFVVQMFSRSVDGLSDITSRAFDAFDGEELAVAGNPVASQEVASGMYRDPDDDGVLTITHTYRF